MQKLHVLDRCIFERFGIDTPIRLLSPSSPGSLSHPQQPPLVRLCPCVDLPHSITVCPVRSVPLTEPDSVKVLPSVFAFQSQGLPRDSVATGRSWCVTQLVSGSTSLFLS